MDSKDLINIDDLVRQRLGGGEEGELPGAWPRMLHGTKAGRTTAKELVNK